jgi:chromosome segregation ATPase
VSESLLHEKGEEFKTVEDEKSIKLERAQCNLEDTTARVNALAKQNGLLRAQYEQLKVKSNSKERDFARQLTKATKEAKEAENLKKKASSLEKRLVEKERKLALVSKELTDRTSFAEKAANGMNEKDAVLIQMRSTVEEMKYHAEEVGKSHQTTVTKLELKLTEMSEELNAQATESGQIHEENAHTRSMLEGASMRNEEISKKMEEERVQHQAVMHTFKNDHEEQLKNEREKSEKALVQLDEERVQHQDVMHTFKNDHEEQLKEEREKSEKALVQLSDSKQIIESTTSELHARLFALQLEFDKKSQSEKQLLLQMSERERDLRRENEMIHQNLIEANSNKSTIDNKFQQSQQHLSETSQKVETLEIDLGKWQQKNACLVSEREYLTTKLEENELEYRDLLASTTQNKSLQDALMTESHDLRLELSELKRSSDTNEQHLANQIQKQKTEFDIELSELKKSVEIKEQQLINQIQQRDAGFDHEKLKLDEQIADSKAFTQTLMTQLETESNKSSGVYNQKVSKLESDLTEIEDIVQKLKQDKEQIADSLQLCVEERDALACDNAKLAKRLESSQEDAKRWMQTSRVASSDLSELKQISQAEKEGYDSRCNGLQDTIDHLTLERDAFKSELQDLFYRSAAEKQSLETKLQRTEEDLVLSKTAIDEEASNGALMMQVIELEDKLRYSKSEAEQQKEFLQDELTKQSDTLDVKISNLQTSFSESVKEKEDFIENLLSEIEDKQSTIQGLTNAKGKISSEYQELVEDRSRKEDQVSLLTSELEALKKDLATTHDEIALSMNDNEKVVQDLKHQLALGQHDIELQMERTDRVLSESSNHTQIRIQQIQANFKESTEEKEQFIENIQREIENKQDSIATLEHDYQNASERVDALEAELFKVQNQFEALQKDLERSTADATKQSEIVRANQDSQQSKQQIFRDYVAEKEEFIANLQQEIENKQDSIDRLDIDREDAFKRVELLETEVCEVRIHSNEVHKDLDKTKADAMKQRDLVRAIQESNQSQNGQTQKEFDSSLATKEVLISELQKEVENKQDSIDALIRDQQDAQSTEEFHKSMQEKMQSTMEETEIQHKEVQRKLMITVAETQKEISDLNNNHKSALKQAAHTALILQEKVDSLESTIRELTEKERITKYTLEESRLQFQEVQDLHLKNINEQQELFQTSRAESKKLEFQLEGHTRKATTDLMEHHTFVEKMQNAHAAAIIEKEDAIRTITEDIDEKTRAFDILANSFDKAVSESKSMSEQISDLQNQVIVSEDTAKTIEHKLQKETNDSEESTKMVIFLKGSLAVKETERISLQHEACCLSECRAREKEEFEIFREKSERFKESLEQDLELAQSTHAHEIAILQELQLKERTGLSQNLDVAHASVTKCREQLHNVQNNLKEKDEHSKKMIIEANHKESQISLITRQKEAEVMILHDLSSSLQKDIKEKSTENEILVEKLKVLQESAETSKRFCSNIETDLRNVRNEASTQNHSSKRLLADLVNTCKSLKLKDEEYIFVSDSSIDSARELVRCLREAVKNEHSNAIACLELANSRERAVSRLERTLNAKDRDIISLRRDVDKFKASITDLKNQQLSTKSRNTELKIQIKNIENEMASAEDKCFVSEELTIILRQEKSELEMQVSRSAVEIERLQTAMSVAETTISEYELKLMILGVAKDQASEQTIVIKILQTDLEDVATEMEYMIQQNESIEREVETTQQKLQISETHANLFRKKSVQLEEELVERLTEISGLEDKNSSLYNQNLSLLETIEEYNAAVGELKQDLSSTAERNVVERSNLELRIQSQKRIATILEKHLSERSAELQNLRQNSASDAYKLQKELQEHRSSVHDFRLNLDEAHLTLLLASKEKAILEKELKESEITANTTVNALRADLDETQSKLMVVSKEKEKLENDLKENEASANTTAESLREDHDDVCSKLLLASKEKAILEKELKESEITANATVNALRADLDETQSKLMVVSKEKEKLENDLKENEASANTTTESLREDHDDVCSKLLLASKEKAMLEKELKESEITANTTVNALRADLDETQSKLMVVLKEKENLDRIEKDNENAAAKALRSELNEAQSKLLLASKEMDSLQNSHKETEATANDAINLIEQKDSRIKNLLENVEELESSKSSLIAKFNEESNRLAALTEVKLKEVKRLEEKVSALNRAVTTSHKKIDRCEKQSTAEKEKYRDQIDALENNYQDAKARLFGCEKLAIIHDEECTRLLNDIESKSEQIHSLKQKVENLESHQDDLYSKANELEGALATQKDIISTLEEELLENSELSTFEEDRDNQDYGDCNRLKERVRSLDLQLEDRETELEILLNENKGISCKLAEADFKLEASEEEVQLLCESIEEKEREINHLHEAIEQVSQEKTDAISLLSDVQERVHQQQECASSKSPLCNLHANYDDEGSLGISRPSLSPTASEIIHKHSELLDDLVKMKSAIHEAMSPSKSVDDELSSSDRSISAVRLLQQELAEKNSVLSRMSNQVDSLMYDINQAKAALSDKDSSVQELKTSLIELEDGKAELKKKLKSRKAYIKQLEDALSHEVRHRRDMENTLSSTQQEKKALAVDYQSKTKELESAQKEIKEKEDAVAEQMNVARNLAKQLHTTKGKICALKQHLQQEGLLKNDILPPVAPIPYQSPLIRHSVSNKAQHHHHIPQINATMSNDSINWSISDEDSS